MAPTGVALQDARARLFEAADRVVLRDGANGLTSRAVTEELGVAKGVLHRHFPDFDTFLAEWVEQRVAGLGDLADRLRATAGTASVVTNLRDALSRIFDPLGLATIRIVIARDGVRARLRASGDHPLSYLGEATSVLTTYLADEQRRDRLVPSADPRTLALALMGSGHLLFAGELGALPSEDAVDEVVASIIVGAEPGGHGHGTHAAPPGRT
ncbi:TetR/AcrR family transcriptional regulator [Rathayibacter sp. CAU 1779]